MLASTPEHKRAVAPPGRRLREESRRGSMPVVGRRAAADRRRAPVMCQGEMSSTPEAE